MEEIFICFSFSSLISSTFSLNMHIPQPLKGVVLQDTLVSDFQRTVSLIQFIIKRVIIQLSVIKKS